MANSVGWNNRHSASFGLGCSNLRAPFLSPAKMTYLFLRPSARTRENAVALLIVLAFLVLLAGITVAYLSRTATDRQVAHGSFNNAKSDQLARSALEIIVANLKQEIVNGSSSTSSNN